MTDFPRRLVLLGGLALATPGWAATPAGRKLEGKAQCIPERLGAQTGITEQEAADLRDAVLAREPADARFFAEGARADRWQFGLAGYCAARLLAAGVAAEVTPHDTLALEDSFFSHRRRTLSGGGPIGHQLSAIAIGG